MTPPALDRVVKTCLAKDPDDRWQSAGDVARELKWIAEGSAPGPAVLRPMRDAESSRAARVGRRGGCDPRSARFGVPFPPAAGARGADALHDHAAFRPGLPRIRRALSGRAAHSVPAPGRGRKDLDCGLRSLDSLEMRRLPGTEDARGMFWSPDGREIAFFSEGRLKRIGADGGPVQTICESGGGFSGAWSREGTILFTKEFGTPIVAVPATGGTPAPVTALDTAQGRRRPLPSRLPSGRPALRVRGAQHRPGEDLRHARLARFEGCPPALPCGLRRHLRRSRLPSVRA